MEAGKIMSEEKYHIALRIIHWAMAIIIIGLIAVGWYMEGLDRKDPNHDMLYWLHKSFGSLVLILFFVRVVVRVVTKRPPLPAGLSGMVKKMAHGAHCLLYVFMIAVPLSGYIMSNAYGYGVSLFNISLPKIISKDKEIADLFHELHGIMPYVMLGIIVLHVAGALKHRFVDKENDVLGRML